MISRSLALMFLLVMSLASLGSSRTAFAQTFTTIHDFDQSGFEPLAGLVVDKSGNLYGTTSTGLSAFAGTVFEMSPNGTGWDFSTLYTFTVGADGGLPQGSLALDSAGNLYGTTSDVNGTGGTVFELSPAGGGAWTYKLVHTFTDNPDGFDPLANVILDAQGNLYGTTAGGGTSEFGTVFELSPNGSGGWNESILYNFKGGSDGRNPQCGLVFDATGNLYGTTEFGGSSDQGTVFQLTPNGDGTWQETILSSLNSHTGYHPEAGLAIDKKGNLYGTTVSNATVFELSPLGDGKWTKKVIHTFQGLQGDGTDPQAPLTVGVNGALYGTTLSGGNQACECGTVFQLTRASNGTWTERILYNFTVQNGDEPRGAVVFDAVGNLYGTTKYGNNGFGSVFEISRH